MLICRTEFDKLGRMIQKQHALVYSIPSFYIRTLFSLDESLGSAIAREKEAKKKMNATNAKALTAMKQKVKKALKEYEQEIKTFQEVWLSVGVNTDAKTCTEPRSLRAKSCTNECDAGFGSCCFTRTRKGC
jgi:hypothetical protein